MVPGPLYRYDGCTILASSSPTSPAKGQFLVFGTYLIQIDAGIQQGLHSPHIKYMHVIYKYLFHFFSVFEKIAKL
jgi:hypothetical protein